MNIQYVALVVRFGVFPRNGVCASVWLGSLLGFSEQRGNVEYGTVLNLAACECSSSDDAVRIRARSFDSAALGLAIEKD
ncbi:hypothetical protein AMELA_G00121940 [Ameiurus melas]|uniref:Uncharacterized protein n=1 Tax=Ameiurus melas TaxID=219545 RepID=A0A7J6AP43_AMEME|nr:hypothetical protein AMELA_G00121940 [Ameiurus melas]